MKPTTASTKAAILTMSVVQMGTNAISPILADVAAAFPEADASTVQFLMTFPSLTVLFFSLIAAGLATKISKKYIAAVGCALFFISGILSWLFHGNLVLLFVWAGLMGIGIGIVVPMATSLVTDCFSGAEEQGMMGLQSAAANLGGMIMTFLGGLLAAIHWSCNYLVYLIAVPGFVFTLIGLPGRLEYGKDRQEAAPAKSNILYLLKKPAILGNCLLAVIITMLFNTAPTNLSMFLAEKQLGTASQAGTATTLLLLSGTIGGFCFGRLAAKLGRYVMVCGFCLLALGHFVCSLAPCLAVVFLGCLICGCAISMVMPQAILDAASKADGNTAGASALAMTSSYLGAFCSPLLTIAVQEIAGKGAVAPRFMLSGSCALLTAVILIVILRRQESAPDAVL